VGNHVHRIVLKNPDLIRWRTRWRFEEMVPAAAGSTVTGNGGAASGNDGTEVTGNDPTRLGKPPWEGTAERKATEAGRRWLTTTFLAVLGPRLVTEIE